MSTCPSCGRDAGTSEICPHCGTDLKRRMRVRTFGILAIVVAVVGVAILLFFASRAPVPTVKIGDIQSTSNYAYVQITGVVSRGPTYSPDSQTITFWVSASGVSRDNSAAGALRVRANVRSGLASVRSSLKSDARITSSMCASTGARPAAENCAPTGSRAI